MGGNATLFALVAAKAPYGIAKGMGYRGECFEFRSGATKDDNFLLFFARRYSWDCCFDFEFRLGPSRLRDVTFKVGL